MEHDLTPLVAKLQGEVTALKDMMMAQTAALNVALLIIAMTPGQRPAFDNLMRDQATKLGAKGHQIVAADLLERRQAILETATRLTTQPR